MIFIAVFFISTLGVAEGITFTGLFYFTILFGLYVDRGN